MLDGALAWAGSQTWGGVVLRRLTTRARSFLLGLGLLGVALGSQAKSLEAPVRPLTLIGRPQVQAFTDREGLRQNSVEAVAMDEEGYAWIGTQDGAMRYDGKTWKPLDMPLPQRSNWVTCMVLAKGGPRWFGTNGAGIGRWDGAWTVFDTTSGLPSDTVFSLVEGIGTLWAGTASGPVRWTGNRWEPLAGTQPWQHGPVRAVLVLGDARHPDVWVGADDGLGHFLEGRWTWHGQAGLPSRMVRALMEGETGGLWVGTQAGLAFGGPGHWRVYSAPGVLPHPTVSCLKRTVSREGKPVLWVGTEGGLLRWEGSKRRVLGRAEGLTSPVVRSLLIRPDPSGREAIWVGTFGGLVRFTEGTWATLDTQDGLPDNLVFSFHEDRAHGILWFGTNSGLVSYQQGRWRTHGTAQGLPLLTVFALEGDGSDGSLWVGTRGQGLYRLARGQAHAVPGLPDSFVYSLHASQDPDGARVLWVGTRKGISKWRSGAWVHYGPRQHAPEALVSSITETRGPDGRLTIWAGTRGAGLGALEPGGQAWTWFDVPQGLVDARVMHLLPMVEGGIPGVWVATQGGLQWFRARPAGPTDLILTQASHPALPGNLVYTVQQGADKALYAFTNHGVWRRNPGPEGTEDVQTFTTGDGLPSNGCVQGASLVDAQGRIWVGTVRGVAILDPYARLLDEQPRPLYLDEALNGSTFLPPSGPWVLPWRARNLKVRFSLLSFHREADTRFCSQMMGLEAGPSPWTPSETREFVSLPPGHYTLRFWGLDYAGHVSGPVDVPVLVQAPPWQRWWALLAYALLLTGAVVALILWRVRQLQQRNAELEARVLAATGEVRRQNDILARVNQHLGRLNEEKSSMLGIAAHDLRNPLSGMALVAESLRGTGAGAFVEQAAKRILDLSGQMAQLIERLLNSSRIDAGQISMHMEAVAPAILLMDLVQRHQGAARAKGLELVLDLPESPLPEMLADPFHLMEVLDNLVSNALKFTPKGPPQRQVVLRARPGLIEVQDEGPGFTEEDQEHAFERFRRLSAKPTAGEGSTGLGLSIAKALLEAMGGEIELISEAGHGAIFRIHLGKA